MHHTDYSTNVRRASRKILKNSYTTDSDHNSDKLQAKDRLYAGVAAMLVLICLFQMDLANADDSFHNAGYGALTFDSKTKPQHIEAIDSTVKITIHDDRTVMSVEQIFAPQNQHRADILYALSLPRNARVKSSQIFLQHCVQAIFGHNKIQCQVSSALDNQTPAVRTAHHPEHWTLALPLLNKGQRLRVSLDVVIPTQLASLRHGNQRSASFIYSNTDKLLALTDQRFELPR